MVSGLIFWKVVAYQPFERRSQLGTPTLEKSDDRSQRMNDQRERFGLTPIQFA